ncbi:hypothetical protein FACS1894103_7200 [Campylobacterota bacterium]|nr:hypothetical protein FACS1894103_7200 [Campylobacterota bacterium]
MSTGELFVILFCAVANIGIFWLAWRTKTNYLGLFLFGKRLRSDLADSVAVAIKSAESEVVR